uniref:Uncharacterized protein n=1 Tax=Vespula pensylvanica TaxID=30213 RepID=A0A834PA61_VESPE|nr:hypothetical protein H0235_002384 [Vespula pensylvanica]
MVGRLTKSTNYTRATGGWNGDWGLGIGEWGMGVLAGSTGGLTEWRVNRSTAGFDVNTKASGSERAMPDKSLVYCPGTTDLRRLFRSGTGNQAARGQVFIPITLCPQGTNQIASRL